MYRSILVSKCAVLCLVAQSCLTLCYPMDYSPPVSSSIGILPNCCRYHLLGGQFTPSQWLCWELCAFLFSKINPIHFRLWVFVCSWGSFFSFTNKNSDSPFSATWEARCFCNNNNINKNNNNKIKMLCFYKKLQIKGINLDLNLVKCFCITSLFWELKSYGHCLFIMENVLGLAWSPKLKIQKCVKLEQY